MDKSLKKLRLARKARGLTQAQAAELLGVASNTWSRWERGEIELSVSRIRQIAEALRCKPGDLL